MGELTDEQIVDVANRYFGNFINGLEKIRVEPGAFGKGDVFRRVNQINQSICNRAKRHWLDSVCLRGTKCDICKIIKISIFSTGEKFSI